MKTYQYGNTIVTVNSPLLAMTDEERSQWYSDETASNNPKLQAVEDAVHNLYEDRA